MVSLVANVALVIGLALSLKKPDQVPVDLSKHTQQDIGKAWSVTSGMNSAAVKSLLGEPVVRELLGSREEWHYCRTGATADEYVAISFQDQKVDGIQYYTVSWLDMVFHYVKQPTEQLIDSGGMGDCRLTVRWGTYGQRTPSYPENPPARSKNVEPPST